MLRFIARRILAGVVLMLAISALAFVLLYAAADDTARQILGPDANAEAIAAKNHDLGLDRPVFVQYLDWLWQAVRGDLGQSWYTQQGVVGILGGRLPVTLSLVTSAIVLTAILSLTIGTIAAVRRGWLDRVIQAVSLVFDAIPSFITAIVLVSVFAIQFGLLPATGYTRFESNPGLWATSLLLPVIALVAQTTAASAQQFRSAIIEVQRRDFVRTLRARHIPPREILVRHVLRAAAPAGLTVLSLQFVGLLGGSVIIEQIFALPGLGPLAVTSTVQGDVPVVMGIVIYMVAVVIIVNLLVDLAIGWLNPKARIS